METEIWKNIKDYEGLYQISNLGNIKSLNYKRTGKESRLKLTIDKDGYTTTTLCNNRIYKIYKVHRLVAQTFIDNTENKLQVNHKNGIRNDNRLDNLEWCTQSENELHKYKFLQYRGYFQTNNPNIGKFGILNHNSKKVNQYTKEGEFIKTWDSIMDIKRELNISNGHISDCCRLKNKTAGGFIWKY